LKQKLEFPYYLYSSEGNKLEKMKILFLCLFGTIIFDGLLACTNKFDGKDVRAGNAK